MKKDWEIPGPSTLSTNEEEPPPKSGNSLLDPIIGTNHTHTLISTERFFMKWGRVKMTAFRLSQKNSSK